MRTDGTAKLAFVASPVHVLLVLPGQGPNLLMHP